MTCTRGCSSQAISSCANEDSLTEAASQLVDLLVQSTFREILDRFHVVSQFASIAKCALDGDWPPVKVVFSSNFSQVEGLEFSKSVWGKYMFRIHSLAGTVS